MQFVGLKYKTTGCEAARVCPAEERLFKVVRFGVAHSRAPMYRMYTEEGLRGAAGEFARMKELSGGREVQVVGWGQRFHS